MTAEGRDNLIATGFLRTCIDPTASPETNFSEDRQQVLADTVEIVSSSLLGLTLRCARCHNHKYDPLPQRDYYQFTAIFAAAYAPNDWVKPQERTIEMVGIEDRRETDAHNTPIQLQLQPLTAQIAALTKEFQERYHREHVDKPAADDALLKKTYPEFKERAEKLAAEKEKLEAQLRSPPQAHGLTDRQAEPDPYYLLRRGEWNNRGGRVLPDVPAVLKRSPGSFQVVRPFKDAPTSGARLALARWLTQTNHPLTARVIVNRIWQHHFGRGIVTTPDDFGKTSVLPSHPELLDWLAIDFVNHGWSLKHLHRLILSSSAWRQQSRVRDDAAAIDPENRLLWRMSLQRMDAEVVRDSMLAVAGKLNATMFGATVPVDQQADGQGVTADSAEGNRRSIYLLHRRSTPVAVLETFDAPRLTTNCTKRRNSTPASPITRWPPACNSPPLPHSISRVKPRQLR